MMNESMTMDEVPAWVWRFIYTKWDAALETGWYPELWTKCALCNWIDFRKPGCVNCPINPCWCRARPELSRLHIGYTNRENETWEQGIEEFLEYIKPYCKYETNQYKDNRN